MARYGRDGVLALPAPTLENPTGKVTGTCWVDELVLEEMAE